MYKYLILLMLVLFLPSLTSQAQTNQPVIIGIDADFSAVAIDGGLSIRRGVELAVDELNAGGGILGRPVTIVAKDHRGNPARGIHNINNLASLDNLLAIIGGVHTPVALAELETIHKNNVLYLGPWAAGTPVVDNGYIPNNVFRVSLRDAEAGKVLVAHALSKGITNVTLVLERTGWGRSNEASLTKAAKSAGVTIDAIHWINWQQKTFLEDLAIIKQSKTQALILVTNAPEGAVVVNELRQADMLTMPVISHWGIAAGNFIDLIEVSPTEIDISVLQTFHFSRNTTQKASSLLQAYTKKYGPIDKIEITAAVGIAHAYDLVHLVAQAAKEAGTIETDKVRTVLENIPVYEGAVKYYAPPFSSTRHDALFSNDYFMTTFDEQGNIVLLER